MSGVTLVGLKPETLFQEAVILTSCTLSSSWVQRAVLFAKKAQVKRTVSLEAPVAQAPVALESAVIHKLIETVYSFLHKEELSEDLEGVLSILSSLWLDLEDSSLRKGTLLSRYAQLRELGLYPLICRSIESATGCRDGSAELLKNPRILLKLYLPNGSPPLKWLKVSEDMQWFEYLFAFFCIKLEGKEPLEMMPPHVKLGFYEPLIKNRHELENEVVIGVVHQFRLEFSDLPLKAFVSKVASVKEDRFKVAILKEWASLAPDTVVENIHLFNIFNSDSLLDVLSFITQIKPELVASHIHLFRIRIEMRFYLAKQIAALNPACLISYLPAFQIGAHPNILSILLPLAKLNSWQICTHFTLLGMTDPVAVCTLALELAGFPEFSLGKFIKVFGIADGAKRFEIAMKSIEYQTKETLLNLSSFDLNPAEQQALIEKAALIHPTFVLKKLPSLAIGSKEFTESLLLKLIRVRPFDVLECLEEIKGLNDETLTRLEFLSYYELAKQDLLGLVEGEVFMAVAKFPDEITHYPELFALELNLDPEIDRCKDAGLFQSGGILSTMSALRAMYRYTFYHLSHEQMTPPVQAILKQIMSYPKLPEAFSLLEAFCTLIQKGKFPTLLSSIEPNSSLVLPMIWLTALEEFGNVDPTRAFLIRNVDLLNIPENGTADALHFALGQVYGKLHSKPSAARELMDSVNALTVPSSGAISPYTLFERFALFGALLLLNRTPFVKCDPSIEPVAHLRKEFIDQMLAVPGLNFNKIADFNGSFFKAFGTLNLAHRFPIYVARVMDRANGPVCAAFSDFIDSVLGDEFTYKRYDSKYSLHFRDFVHRTHSAYWAWQEDLKQLFHIDFGNAQALKVKLLAIYDTAPFLFDETDVARLHAFERLTFEDQQKMLFDLREKKERSERKDHPLWIELQKILNPIKIGEIVETDSASDLILSQMHRVETTLNWKYLKEPIRDSLEVFLDGKHRVICIKDGEGKVLAHSIIKLLISSSKREAAIFQEPIDKAFRKPLFESAFLAMTLLKARALKVCAFAPHASGPLQLYSMSSYSLCKEFSIDPDSVHWIFARPLA